MGQSLETMTMNGAEEILPPVMIVEGRFGQLNLDVGGAKPTVSTLRLNSTKMDVDGMFKKGDLVTFEITARITEVTLADKTAPDGWVERTERRHVARAESVQIVETRK